MVKRKDKLKPTRAEKLAKGGPKPTPRYELKKRRITALPETEGRVAMKGPNMQQIPRGSISPGMRVIDEEDEK